MRKVACGLHPLTTASGWQESSSRIRVKVRNIYAANAGGTDGNDRQDTKDGIDYDRRNLVTGGYAVGHRSR